MLYSVSMNRRDFLVGLGRSTLLLSMVPLAPSAVQYNTLAKSTTITWPGATALLESDLVQHYFRAGTGPFWVAGRFLNAFADQAARYLNYDQLAPSWHNKYRSAGGESKPYLAARALWEQVPASVRARGPAALKAFHRNKDWSHILPRAMAGPTTVENGIWWSSRRNKQLGAKPMSQAQILQARAVLTYEGTVSAVRLALKPMLGGATAGAVLVMLLTVLDYGLQYAQGTITQEELYRKVIEATLLAGARALIIAGLITGLVVAFPSLLPIAPLVLMPLTVLGGIFVGQELIDLGLDWWLHLESQGVLAEFLTGLVMVETALSAWFWAQYVDSAQKRMGQLRSSFPVLDQLFITLVDLDADIRMPAFDYTQYFPDLEFDLHLNAYVPAPRLPDYLGILELDVKQLVPAWGPDFLDGIPHPDFRGGMIAAQEALKQAAALQDARPLIRAG